MAPNILITGVTGFIGGTLLQRLLETDLFPRSNIWVAVRSEAHEDRLRALQVNIARVSLDDAEDVRKIVLGNKIDIVVHTAGALKFSLVESLLNALGARKAVTKRPVHLIQTSGASTFADKCGWTFGPGRESDDLYTREVEIRDSFLLHETNIRIIETGEALGVLVYLVLPPLVCKSNKTQGNWYTLLKSSLEQGGKGTGTGNTATFIFSSMIQTALAQKKVYYFPEKSHWPVVHVVDLANYYILLLKAILANSAPGPTPAAWPSEEFASDATGLSTEYCQIAFNSTTAVISERGHQLGWKPEWDYAEWLRDFGGMEVDPILESDVQSKDTVKALGNL
ncbi:hypothetical protein N7468_000314 [Penicillium chermesinum]|uniref:NAD-dependent epimerase/dehydratase domain-containing protein n=1 Tax=Penicillium chermesinum TaxID=63820 RepID=A0A9W9PK14_9EURO|nr:uncharacterized protein N7468_000314 [Penicillium chermesinum]KAJ5248863.1 hypothetical protein N7468_000314 [Penicillium chermesinum]